MGLMGTGIRLPLTVLSEPLRAPLETVIREAGVALA
jgi:hypothetical protein